MVGSWKTFIQLKDIGRLRSKTLNVVKPMKAEFFFFPEVRSKRGCSFS